MRTIEQMEVDIKKNWFPNHVATVTEYETVTILDWRKPGTNMYSVKYIFTGNRLYISGDIGDAIFHLTWYATIQSFKRVDISYLMGKLACCSRNRWDFIEGKARQEVTEWYNEGIEDMTDGEEKDKFDEFYTKISSAIGEYSYPSHFEQAVWKIYYDLELDIEGEEVAMIGESGRQLPSVFVAYLLGIKMAIEQLNLKEGE